MQSCLLAELQDAQRERLLQERLAAGKGDPPARPLIKGPVAHELCEEGLRRPPRTHHEQCLRIAGLNAEAAASAKLRGEPVLLVNARVCPVGAALHAGQAVQAVLDRYSISLCAPQVSGLWHQKQRSGHPFKKASVRIPGPSWRENRCTSETKPRLPSAYNARDSAPAPSARRQRSSRSLVDSTLLLSRVRLVGYRAHKSKGYDRPARQAW